MYVEVIFKLFYTENFNYIKRGELKTNLCWLAGGRSCSLLMFFVFHLVLYIYISFVLELSFYVRV